MRMKCAFIAFFFLGSKERIRHWTWEEISGGIEIAGVQRQGLSVWEEEEEVVEVKSGEVVHFINEWVGNVLITRVVCGYTWHGIENRVLGYEQHLPLLANRI